MMASLNMYTNTSAFEYFNLNPALMLIGNKNLLILDWIYKWRKLEENDLRLIFHYTIINVCFLNMKFYLKSKDELQHTESFWIYMRKTAH